MRKFLFLISFLAFTALAFSQATATLRVTSTDPSGLVPNDKVYVSIVVDAISDDEIWGFQFFVGHDQSVITWDGSFTNPGPGISYLNPKFPNSAGALFNLNSESEMVYLWGDGFTSAEVVPGEIIITFIFTYHGGETVLEWDWIISGGQVTEMYDEMLDYYALTLIDGCVCSPKYDVTFNVTDSGAPLDGVDVTVGTETVTTGLDGVALFSLANGNYTYVASKATYYDVNGSFEVASTNLTIPVSMNLLGSEFDITFVVTSGGMPVPGATVEAGGKTAVTDALGEAILSLANGSYTYTVSKYGYTTEIGPFTVASAPLTIPVALTALPQYAITFQVTSGGNNLDNALVNIPGVGSVLTDASGQAVFSMVDGVYNYTVTKAGYQTVNGAVTVAGAAQTVNVAMNQIFDITFHVTSGGMNLPGAAITIGSETKFTNAAGNAVFNLVDGAYSYLVTKTDYQNESGNFTVAGANLTIPVSMTFITYTATFHVTSDGDDIEGATVTVGTEAIDTDVNGMAVFNLPNGFYNYTVEKAGYFDDSGDFEINNNSVTVNVSLLAVSYNITFHVTSGGSNLSGAAVTVNGETKITNAQGNAVFGLQNGDYDYTVTKDGYDDVEGTVTVASANQTVEVTMVLTLYDITFHVTSDGEDLEGATVTIAGQTLTTPANGIVVFNLPNGTYSYTVTKDDYSPVSGNITVSSAPQTIDIQMVKILYQTIFAVINPNNQPISGAAVTVEGFGTQNTPGNGTVIFQLPNGSYPYTVVKDGFITGSGTVVVSGAGQTVIVQLQFQLYDITFVVTDTVTTNPLEGAVVTIGTQNQTTPANGTVVFQLANGTYNYTVTKALYETATGQVTVSSAPQTIEVELNLIPGVNEMSVRNFSLYPNPSDGLFYLSTTATGHDLNLSVYDLAGRVIYNDISGANSSHMIDLSGQDKGMYILQIIADGNVITKTLVIQ